MKKTLIAVIFTCMMSVLAMAQDDYKKGEFYIGYSHGRVETGGVGPATQANTGVGDRQAFHGFGVSGVYNVSRYFGIKGDVSGTYNNTRFSFPVTTGGATQTVSFDSDRSLYNFLGGIQVKDNSSEGRVKPFAHALAGVARASSKISNKTCTSYPAEWNGSTGVDDECRGWFVARGQPLTVGDCAKAEPQPK